MRKKTYLSPGSQWDRSVALTREQRFLEMQRKRLGEDLYIARIVAPHRLFTVGDIVLAYISNGMMSRQPVWAVSSKGYVVRDFYMQNSRYRGRQPFDAGPLRFVELPGHLSGKTPDDPAVRQFVVGTLRAGDAAAR